MRTDKEVYTTNIADIAKDIRSSLKKEFPDCKFSVRIKRFSMGQSMAISLISAPFEAFKTLTTSTREVREKQYAQLNQYQLLDRAAVEGTPCNGSYLTKEAIETMRRAVEIAGEWNYNHSDLQSDYHDVNFFLHVNVGEWDKEFVRKETGQ